MEQYLSVVKVGKANLVAVEEGGNFNDVKSWPSFLNAAAERDKPYWERYISGSNYLRTYGTYTKEGHSDYTTWLMERPFSNSIAVMQEMAMFLKNSDFLDKFKWEYSLSVAGLTHSVVFTDNVEILKYILRKEDFNFTDTVDILRASLMYKARRCTKEVLHLLERFRTQPMDSGIWTHMSSLTDYSVALSIKRFLDVTPFKSSMMHCREMKRALFASAQRVNLMMLNLTINDEYKFDLVLVLLLRIPHNKIFADVLFAYAKRDQVLLNEEFKEKLTVAVMGNERPEGHTSILIKALYDRGILFRPGHVLDINGSVFQALVALVDEMVGFSYEQEFWVTDIFGEKLVLEDEKIDEIKIDEMKLLLQVLIPKIRYVNLAALFTYMNSSVCKWAYQKGYLDNVDNAQENLKLALLHGNTIVSALCLKTLEKTVGVAATNDIISESSEWVSSECSRLLSCWSGSTEEQRERLLVEPFGTNYQDVSLLAMHCRLHHGFDLQWISLKNF